MDAAAAEGGLHQRRTFTVVSDLAGCWIMCADKQGRSLCSPNMPLASLPCSEGNRGARGYCCAGSVGEGACQGATVLRAGVDVSVGAAG